MNKQFLAVLLLGLVTLSACSLTSKGGAPECTFEELTSATVTYPEMYAVIDEVNPTITWEYHTECQPHAQVVEIYRADRLWRDWYHGIAIPAGRQVTFAPRYPFEEGSPGHTFEVWISPMTRDGRAGPGGLATIFNIGPLCSAGTIPTAPSLLWFLDDWTMDPTSAFELEWENTMTCWPDHNFIIQLSKNISFSRVIELSSPAEELRIYSGLLERLGIENCARYYWRVRADLGGRSDEPWSEVRSFVTHTPGTICPINLFDWPIPEPIEKIPASVVPLSEVNCRYGPSLDYPVLSMLPEGIEYEIRGRNQDRTYWLIFDPKIQNTCWVFGALVTARGDLENVDIVQPPPPEQPAATETTAPVDCSQYNNDQKACTANPACKWEPNLYPNSPCVNK